MSQTGRSWLRLPMWSLHFLLGVILPAALGSGVYSASNRNEYEKQTKFMGSRPLPARKADILTAICEPK
jgi:hypothetical protein